MFGDSTQVVNAYAGHERSKADAYKAELRKGPAGSFLFIADLSVNQTGKREFMIEFIVKSLEPFYGHIGWAILRRDMFQITFMSTHMQGREPILFDSKERYP